MAFGGNFDRPTGLVDGCGIVAATSAAAANDGAGESVRPKVHEQKSIEDSDTVPAKPWRKPGRFELFSKKTQMFEIGA